MFLKLLKHDFKSYTRNFMAIVIGILCFTILLLFQNHFLDDSSFIEINGLGIINGLNIISMIAAVVILIYSIVLGIKIFNQKFISQESYLTFSLPVTKNQQLLSNLIVCFIWCIIVSVFYYAFMSTFFSIDYSNPVDFFEGIIDYFNSIGLDFLLAMVESVMFLNIIYFCIAFINSAAMKRFSKLIGICLFSVIVYEYIDLKTLISGLCNHDVYMNNIYFLAMALFVNVVFYFSTLYILEKKIEVD